MATFLYRLGRAAAQHKGAFIAAWLVILLAVGGAAAAFRGAFVNSFALPSSQSYQTLERLKTEMPSAAGGSGQIVFISDKPFTDEQKKAINAALGDVEKKSHVESVLNPLARQQQLDDGRKKIADFPQQQKDGQAKIDAGTKQLDEAQAKADAGKKDLDKAQSDLDAGKKQLEGPQNRIRQLKSAGLTGPASAIESQIAPQVAQIEAAQKQIDAGRAELAAGQKKIDDGRAQLKDAQKKLDDGAAQVAAAKKQLDSTEGLRFVSEDGTTAAARVTFDTSAEEVPKEDLAAIQETADKVESTGVQVEYSKELVGQTPSLAGPAEIIGVCIAALLLFLMLGTLVAAGLPLLTALIGLAVGLGGTMALSSIVEFSSVSLSLGSMLGLAVGIDYSLFIVNRYRSNRLKGIDKVEAIGLAVGTAGNAVTFAGLTVIIALAALVVVGIPFLGVMGLVGAATIAVAVLVALTLTPALLSAAGNLALPKRLRTVSDENRAARASGRPIEEHAVKERAWGRLVTSRPWLAVAASVLLLGLVAIPSAQIRLALPDGSQEAADSTQYKAYTAVGQAFGEGTNGPLIAVTDLPAGLSQEEAEEIQYKIADRIRSMEDVTAAVPGGLSENRQTGVIQVIPKDGPASLSTKELVDTLKAESDEITAGTDSSVSISGQAAIQIDVSETLAQALPIYLAIVVGLSLIVLILVFRSILVPLMATGGFLLSLFATLGAVVAIYQFGFLQDLFQVTTPGPILSFLPTIVIGILFGLAMDYQMFLVSGMREAHVHGEDARTAVRTGFNHGARVVTVAALIMVSVFAGFIFAHDAMIRPMGFALAFGVLADAFVVRMTLIPALMHLLGEKAWWLPGWLDRILPDVDVEGARLETQKTHSDTV